MTSLDRVIPTPALVETDEIDLAATPSRVWELVRHGNLGESPLVHALFAMRTLPERIALRKVPQLTLCIDDMKSSTERPGFQVLAEEEGREVVIGAIGKAWHLEIPFVHLRDAEEFRTFREPGFVKVAWSLRVTPLGDSDTRLFLEVRVDATDPDSWSKFRRYFALIGPGSHFIRRSLLATLSRRLGTPESHEETRALPGDTFLPDATEQITQGITIAATPAAIWPWLVQMGCRRGGFYSIDALDNDLVRSAREVHRELQDLAVGEVLPATPDGEDGFEVLAIDRDRALVLGGLYDADAKRQRAFSAARPEHYWHATWAFVLEALDERSTRLHVRGRAAFPRTGRFHAEWIRPVHNLMQSAQLRHLAARVEGRLPKDDWRDVLEGIGGASIMAAAFLTPFMRGERNHWGLVPELVDRAYPGDDIVASPRWSWTHGVEIDAPAEEVWPWVAQLGADRGGFYSYQWLENVAGCGVRNAESIHSDWAIHTGDTLRLHPKMPALEIAALERGRFFVAHTPMDANAQREGKPWADATWLFFLEPIGDRRSRLISRYRCATSDDIATRLSFGAAVMEPVGFAMDRRMLLGVKGRVEGAAAKRRSSRSFARRSGASRVSAKQRG